jgi:hypothetical protein
MPVNREDLERIVAAAPHFRERWEAFLQEWATEEAPPWYVGMSELAHYVVESYAQDAVTEFPSLFGTIETLLQEGDPELENLIGVGLFEDIQNIASHRDFGAARFRQWLGPQSLVTWDKVDAYARRVAEWTERQEPRWWQFWRRRSTFDAAKALSQVENPILRRIIESDYRKKS